MVLQVQPDTFHHFHGLVYYLCDDDSNLLSSCPEYPTSQHNISTQLFLRHSKLSKFEDFETFIFCLKSLPRPVFSVPGNRKPFVEVCILETSGLFLTQLSFPFLINRHILYIQPLNCLKSTPFLHPHCHIPNQGYHSLSQTIRRSSCGYCYSTATPTLPIHLSQVSKAILFQWETD